MQKSKTLPFKPNMPTLSRNRTVISKSQADFKKEPPKKSKKQLNQQQTMTISNQQLHDW